MRGSADAGRYLLGMKIESSNEQESALGSRPQRVNPPTRREMKRSAKVTVTDLSDKPYKNGKPRLKPWRVRYFAGGKATCRFFRTRDEAESFAKEQRALLNRGLDPEDFREAVMLAKGTGFTVSELLRMAIDAIEANGTTKIDPNITFAQAAEMVIARAVRRNCRDMTLASYRASYARLCRAFGDKPIALINRAFVQNYIDSLMNGAGDGPASETTKRIALTNIRMTLAICGIVQPLRGVDTRSGERKPVRFFSIDQVRALLRGTPDEYKGALVLALFGCIRPHTLERLTEDNVNISERKISMSARQTKDKTPHMLSPHTRLSNGEVSPGTPDTMWLWLERYGFHPVKWQKVQTIWRGILGGVWIHDGLRHTGATNYCALWGVAATAELLTHKGTSLVKRHYAGATWKDKADQFMALTPDSVGSEPVSIAPPPRHIHWPPDEELSRLLWSHRRQEVAAMIGCCVATLAARCAKRGVARPGKGFWTESGDTRKPAA